jgi:hypothetical protein
MNGVSTERRSGKRVMKKADEKERRQYHFEDNEKE